MFEHSQEIIRRFLDFNARIIFNAERNCYPQKHFPMDYLMRDHGRNSKHNHICGKLYRPGNERWLNSGVFIGYADAVFEIVSLIKKNQIADIPGGDQGLMAHAYLSGQFGIMLDVHHRMFSAQGRGHYLGTFLE